MFNYLFLPPIFKGLIALVIAGFVFPLSGVMVLRLNLLPIRYMLMHSLLLGGAIALAFNLPPLLCYIVISLISVAILYSMGKKKYMNMGFSSAVLMVLSLSVASIITAKSDVPAKDTLSLIWGSPFTLTTGELIIFAVIALLLVFYVVVFKKEILSLFFDKDIAFSINKNSTKHEGVMVILLALVISLSMRFVGALLIDALLILPVLIALKRSQSMNSLLLSSCLYGGSIALVGFFTSLYFDLPPSATIALLAGVTYIIIPRRK